jgi:hypothetical protein
MSELRVILTAAGAPAGDVRVLEESPELGTLVSVGGEILLVSAPYDPDGAGVVKLRAVGPPPPALQPRPSALVADLPQAGLVSLQSADGIRALAREFGDRLAPLTMIRLLASQATPIGLPTLFEAEAQLALLGPAQRERDGRRLEPPLIEPGPDGGWHARFATITHFMGSGEPLRVAVHDWHAELSPERGLVWRTAERGAPMPAGA